MSDLESSAPVDEADEADDVADSQTLAIAAWFPHLPPTPAPRPWTPELAAEFAIERALRVGITPARSPQRPRTARIERPDVPPSRVDNPEPRSHHVRPIAVGDEFACWTAIEILSARYTRARCACGYVALWSNNGLRSTGRHKLSCAHVINSALKG